MQIPAFEIARQPRVVFGPGSLARVPGLAAKFGCRALVVTGAHSLQASPAWNAFREEMRVQGLAMQCFSVASEPSPQLVDDVAARFRTAQVEVVVGIGGGSVLDAAKAIAGLLRVDRSVMDYLEGVGPELPYEGPAVPFIAVPTTAGTGSEATRNAVLSVQGPEGFKKSFRDERLVAQYAVLDPDLLASCPPAQIAANGMDALTQLLESYVSTRADPYTDALALSGLAAVRDGLFAWYDHNAPEGRAGMAYAALLSGITLAQAGLGSVHGLAAPLGALFPVPHGVACGTLIAACTAANIRLLEARLPESPALPKYAQAGRLLVENPGLADARARAALVALLEDWTRRLALPRLGAYGIDAGAMPRIVAGCRGNSMKTNPILMTDDEVGEVLLERL